MQPALGVNLWEPPPCACLPPADSQLEDRINTLAKYAAQNGPNGPQFVDMVREKQKDNVEFQFLSGGPGSDYFRWVLYCHVHNIPVGTTPAEVLFSLAGLRLTADMIPLLGQLLDSLSGSKDSIKASKNWFMRCAYYAEGMALFMAHRVVQLKEFDRQLHIIYLVNDILVTSRQPGSDGSADMVALAFRPVLGAMLCAAYTQGGLKDEVKAKLSKILSLWSERNVYDTTTISIMEQAMLRADVDAVVMEALPGIRPGIPMGRMPPAFAHAMPPASGAPVAVPMAGMAPASAGGAPHGAVAPGIGQAPLGYGPPPGVSSTTVYAPPGGVMPMAAPGQVAVAPGWHPGGAMPMMPGAVPWTAALPPHAMAPGPLAPGGAAPQTQGQGVGVAAPGVPGTMPGAGAMWGQAAAGRPPIPTAQPPAGNPPPAMPPQAPWFPAPPHVPGAPGQPYPVPHPGYIPPPGAPGGPPATAFVPPPGSGGGGILPPPGSHPLPPPGAPAVQVQPVSSLQFPPGLIARLVSAKSRHGAPYTPLDPYDIEREGLPSPPVKDAYLRSRLDRFNAEIRDYRAGTTRSDMADSRSAEQREAAEERDRQRDKERDLQPDGTTGMMPDGSFGGLGSSSQYAGLGTHSASSQKDGDNESDIYKNYRKIRSGAYHELLGKAIAGSQQARA